jgi:hypothetical protein
MNNKEKTALFCQFAEFLMNIKELLGFLKKSEQKRVQELLPEIERTFKEYYLNFNCCEKCGHPIPSLPSNSRLPELEELLQKYATRYENRTGESAPIPTEDVIPVVSRELEEQLPPVLRRGLKIDKDVKPGMTVDDLLADFLGKPKTEQPAEEEQPARKKLTVSSRLAELADKDRKPVYHGKLVSIE